MPSEVVYAVDPGTRESALVVVERNEHGTKVLDRITEPNQRLVERLVYRASRFDTVPILVVEQIEAMGMAVGREVFETVWWAGRFHQAWEDGPAFRVTRRQVKLHLCGTMKAKDPNIRQALLDRFGGSSAIGLKKTPGPLYGLKGHEFAALAVAVTFLDNLASHMQPREPMETVSGDRT